MCSFLVFVCVSVLVTATKHIQTAKVMENDSMGNGKLGTKNKTKWWQCASMK